LFAAAGGGEKITPSIFILFYVHFGSEEKIARIRADEKRKKEVKALPVLFDRIYLFVCCCLCVYMLYEHELI